MKKALALTLIIALLSTSIVFAADDVVNVNTADKAQLQTLHGIGSVLSGRVVVEREANGAYKDGLDLQTRVKGIGPKKVERNAARLSFTQ